MGKNDQVYRDDTLYQSGQQWKFAMFGMAFAGV